MSINNKLTLSNNDNSSIRFKDRVEFIENFIRQRDYNNNTSYTNSTIKNYPLTDHWNYLYDLNKIYKSKIKEKREQQKKLKEEEEMKECTFNPNINKNSSYACNNSKSKIDNNINNKTLKKNNIQNSFLKLNLIQRQKVWIEKKKKDINEKLKLKQKEEIKDCIFIPKINKERAMSRTRINSKTISILEDPESYSMYIRRLNNKREEVKKEKIRENLKPGNGNIWKKIKKINSKNRLYETIDYDELRKSKSNDRQNLKKYRFLDKNNHTYIKEEYSLENISRRIINGNIDTNKLYENLYMKNINSLNNPYGKGIEKDDDNNLNKNEINDISQNNEYGNIYNQPIEYGKALNILHDKLYSINLENEEDNI